MNGIIFDCAMVGGWRKHELFDSPRQGRAMRLSYAAFSSSGVYERGSLIRLPLDGMAVSIEDRVRGGLTLEGLEAEGQPLSVLKSHPFWRRVAEADVLACYFLPFQRVCTYQLAMECGVDPTEFQEIRPVDVMRKACRFAQVPWPEGMGDNGPDRFKNPTMEEAYDCLAREGGPRLGELRRSVIEEAQSPIQAFGLCQVRAIEQIWRACK